MEAVRDLDANDNIVWFAVEMMHDDKCYLVLQYALTNMNKKLGMSKYHGRMQEFAYDPNFHENLN